MLNVPSEADLDASVELLSFMWLAAGNDPSVITPVVLALVRERLTQNFGQLPLEFQTLFGNGQAANAAVQTEWAAATSEQQFALTQQYQQALSALGLGPAAAPEGVASDGSDGNSLNADIASNIAWKLSGAGDWSSR
jgi:hypothetical protein